MEADHLYRPTYTGPTYTGDVRRESPKRLETGLAAPPLVDSDRGST